MRVIYLCIVFLFMQDIKTVHSSYAPGPGNLESERWTGSSFNSQSPSGSTSTLCDRTKVNSGDPNAHSICTDKCLALKPEINTICNTYSDNRIGKYFCNRCGMVTEGECSTVAYLPFCWCRTPKESKNQRSTPFIICHSGIQIMRKVTNKGMSAASEILTKSTIKRTKSQEMSGEAAVDALAMYQAPFPRPPTRPHTADRRRRPATRYSSGTNPNTSGLRASPVGSYAGSAASSSTSSYASSSAGPSVPPPQQQEEDWNSRPDGQPEGGILWTDVRISGKDVRVMLDTGASNTIIHEKFVGTLVPIADQSGHNASNQQFQIFGKTTISLEIKSDVSIPITGLVTNLKYEILLGTDFFVAYAAKMKIFDRTMEIVTGQTKVTMAIKFRADAAGVGMMSTDHGVYTALRISARLNGRDTNVAIDTGTTLNIVSKNFVNQQTLRPVANTCTFGGSGPVRFLGATDITLQIGSNKLGLQAFVPPFIPRRNLILGNSFNKKCVELIDYESKSVTLRYPDSRQVVTPALLFKGQ